MGGKTTRVGQRSDATRHESFLAHGRYRWLWWGIAITIIAVAAYSVSDVHGRPSGATFFGYASGTAGALLVAWLTALGVRKRRFNDRGSLKGWVSAHVYLGLALLVVATLHTGFQFGWNVHTLAYALMIGVIVSGAWGVVAYVTLPRVLSSNRTELTEAQMLERLRGVNARLHEVALTLDGAEAAVVRLSLDETRIGGGVFARLGVGSHRCGNRRALAILSSDLHKAGSPDTVTSIVALLREKEVALIQTRRHIKLRTLLDLWLRFHVPLTLALLAALVAHVVSVFFYW